jgi:thioredoxin-related protein
MKFIILLISLTLCIYADSINWEKDYGSALEKAKKENKLLFVFITSKECKFCDKLKNTTLQDKSIAHHINEKYASVIVSKEAKNYPSKLDSKATPMLYFLDRDENIIDYSLGYWDKTDFHFILKDVQKRYAKGLQR